MLKLIYAFIVALPELIEILKKLEKKHQAESDRKTKAKKLKEDLKKIDKAFDEKNIDAFNNVFNS